MEIVVVAASGTAVPRINSSARPLHIVVSAAQPVRKRSKCWTLHRFSSSRSSLRNLPVRWYHLICDVSVDHFTSSFQCLRWSPEERTRCCEAFKDSGESSPCSSFQTSWGDEFVAWTRSTKLVSLDNPLSHCIKILKTMSWQDIFKKNMFIISIQLVLGMMLVMAVSGTINKTQSWALTEENLLFLEAWRTIDRAYVDKTFNGQSWFRYRENALRNEPMNTRKETYEAIKKMVSTLDDPFTRFLEPEKFKSLRVVLLIKLEFYQEISSWQLMIQVLKPWIYTMLPRDYREVKEAQLN